MQYPTVTEKPSDREAVAHDTFIDGLTMAPPAEAAQPSRALAHHTRRRRHAVQLAAVAARV